MQEPTQSPTETVTLHTAGPIPGIPGIYGPGRYIIDWNTRTLTSVERTEEVLNIEPVPVMPIELEQDSNE